MAADWRVNAELVVNSLALLGFNTDEYHDTYLGIAHEIPPVTVNSFDHPNETALMVTLHFLLCKIDSHHFVEDISGCWPYYDQKEKNKFKRAVEASLSRLSCDKLIPPSVIVHYGHWALHVTPSEAEAWALLRSLTDACIEQDIDSLIEEHNQAPAGTADSNFELNGVDVLLSNVVWDHTATVADLDSPDVKQLLKAIDSETRRVSHMLLERNNMQKEAKQYMSELDTRLKEAQRQMEVAAQRLHQTADGDPAALHALSEVGQIEIAQWLDRMVTATALLKDLDESELIGNAHEYLEEDKQQMASHAIFLPSGLHSASAFMLDASRYVTEEEINSAKKSLRAGIDQMVESVNEANQTYIDAFLEEAGSPQKTSVESASHGDPTLPPVRGISLPIASLPPLRAEEEGGSASAAATTVARSPFGNQSGAPGLKGEV